MMKSTVKRTVTLILALVIAASLASCALIRKVSDAPAAKTEDTSARPDNNGYETGFSDSVPGNDKTPVRYTEDQAYELLSHSFPDYDEKLVKIERTGLIVAENDGTEYYIFKVTLPKETKKADESAADTKDANEAKDSETKEVEMQEPVLCYVSVNGVVHKEITGDNVDTGYVIEKFHKKYGDRDEETGFSYALQYKGILKSGENLCYNFAVYKVNNNGAEPVNEYAFNYLVTIDGKMNAESKMEN